MPNTLSSLEPVIFPEAEWLIVAHLRATLPTYGYQDVVVEVRDLKTRPERFITTRLMGGNRHQLVIGEPTIALQVWPGANDDNGTLANTAEGLVYAMEATEVEQAWVRRVTSVGGVVFFPDPETDLSRYQFTVQLNLSPMDP